MQRGIGVACNVEAIKSMWLAGLNQLSAGLQSIRGVIRKVIWQLISVSVIMAAVAVNEII